MDAETLAHDNDRTAGRAVETIRSEEQLRVGMERRAVEVVRLRKRIVTEQRTVTVQVRREELVVERVPLPDTGDRITDQAAAGPEPYVLTLSQEEPVVELRTVPVERVRVTVVRVETEQRPVTAELRAEQIEVVTDQGLAAVPVPDKH